MGSLVQLPCFLAKLWSLNCPKKFIFCNFVLFSARNLSLLKQLVYMHLKVLITLFQKMMPLWATAHKLLAIEISKSMLTVQWINKIWRLQTFNISETVRHIIMNITIFWKCVTRPLGRTCVTCFNRLKNFLLSSALNFKKLTF